MTDTTMTIPTDAELSVKVTAFAADMDRSRNWVIEAVLRDTWQRRHGRSKASRMVDYSAFNPAVSDELPGATAPYYYWSSAANAGNDVYAWYVGFGYGYVHNSSKGNAYHVRAVRGGR